MDKKQLQEYQKYHITLQNRKITGIDLNGNRVNPFLQPVTRDKLPKLYVIKSKEKVLYVGIASQSIRNRLRYGLEAQGKSGYHGYKWKHLKEVDILIWCFPQEKELRRIEAIEAELVYLVRRHTGLWPIYQTEIHFQNTSDEQIETAESIFKTISKLN